MKTQNYLLKSLDNLMDCIALITTSKHELTNLTYEERENYKAQKIYLFADLSEAMYKIEEAYNLIENILIHIEKPF